MFGRSLTVATFTSRRMQAWVDRILDKHRIDACVVVSSAMASYLDRQPRAPKLLLDVVDVDSAKWRRFSQVRPWPLSWVFSREARLLQQHERAVARLAASTFLVTERESALFREVAPEAANKVRTLGNGVDGAYFSPDVSSHSPFEPGERTVVFVGTMDYWPNADAAIWFAKEVLPLLHQTWPDLTFHVVGRNPSTGVRALKSAHVRVTGEVADVRPYLRNADVVVAPMRVSPGLPNKVLEAMSCGQPVVISRACAQVLGPGEDAGLLTAELATEFVLQITRLLESPVLKASLGLRARTFVEQQYRWDAQMAVLDQHLPAATEGLHE